MTDADWSICLRTWRAHAQTDAFRRRLRRAVEIVGEAHALGVKLFAAMSGGKDSAALAGVLCAAGLRDRVPLVYCHSDLNTPGMEETAYAIAEKLDMELDVVEPEFGPACRDVWQFLRELPRDGLITDPRILGRLQKACAAGNMCVAYQYEHDFQGAYTGIRAEESRGRRMNRVVRGHLYRILKDGSWMCHPLQDWSGLDVWAMITSLDLPSVPHYRLLLERYGIDPASQRSRVDCVLTEDSIVGMGSIEQLRVLYPDLYGRIVAIRPELGRM